MATEDEAREVAYREEVQVEAADLGTTHLQMNLHGKLSSHEEIKDEAKIMDSTEGLLKVTEDQVLEEAPSVAEIPPEHTPNGTASSLNGHMKEAKISNEKPQENGQKVNEQVEASPHGISTDQSNKSNGEEAVDSLGHVESTTEDTSLLKHENEEPKEHYQQDVEGAAVEDKMVHEDTLQTDEPTVDAQQGQNLEPAKVTEDTQHASTSRIPHDEFAAEVPAEVQTSLEANVDDSGALPDASYGDTETEPAKVDEESCPEDEDIAEHTNEIIKLEDQPSKQTDDVDADVVQEEVPESKKTDVPEDMTKTEQAGESTNGDQEELNQESPEDTSDPVHEKTEETSHESNVSISDETTPEHDATTRETALDVQEVQSEGLAEETADAKEVDAEETVQQSGVAFEPSSDIQNLSNVESEEIKGLEDAKAEETSNRSNVTIAEDAAQDKEETEDIQPVQGLQEEEPKSTGTVQMDEASNQPHADVLNNLAEEDGVPACQPQVIELEEEVKDTGVTETQEITQQSHVASSEELVTEDDSMAIESQSDDIQQALEQGSVEVKDAEASETQEICHERTISASEEDSAEDDVTAEGPTSDAQEVENRESVEEIKNNTADNIVEASNVATVEEADQENNMLPSEDVPEQQTRELEPEEIQSTEPVETEALNDPAQEDSIPSDMPMTESTAEVTEIEATKTEALPEESKVSISEEPASEENITASEITCDAEEVNNLEPAEDVEGSKDTGTTEISDQSNESNIASLDEMATEDNTTILTDASIQQLQEQELVEFRDTEATEPQGISPSHTVSTSEESTPEDNVTEEPSPDTQAENLESATVTKETKDVKSIDAIAEEETPEEHVQEFEAPVHTPPVEEPELEETKKTDNQMDAAVLENPTHEDSPTASESLVMESAEVSSSEATEGQEMPQSEVTQSEEHGTEENTIASEPKILESELAEEMRDGEATEPRSISQQSIVSSSEESVPEEDVTAKEPASDIKEVQTEEPELIDEQNCVKAGEISNQSSGTIVGETENLESATLTEETRDMKSTDAIAEETPEEHVQEFEAPVDIPPVEEPELEETKNTEPVEVHDNVATNNLPAEEVKNTEATEITEIHNESGGLTEDVKSNGALADEAAPDEHAKATEATDDISQAQDPELEEIKNIEPVEVVDNIIASNLPEEEIKDTEAMETEVIPDESTSAMISELTNDVKSNVALAEEAAPEEHVIETEATIDIPRAQEQELQEIENNDVKAGEISNQSSRTIVGETAQKDLESATVTEETKDVESTDAIAEEKTPELEETKNTDPVEVHDNVTTNDVLAEEVKDTEATEIAENHNESTVENIDDLTEDVISNVALADDAAPDEDAKATEATSDIPQAQDPELEEIKNSEPVEVEDNIIASDLPEEEIKDTEAMETEVIPDESTKAKITELTNDVKSNVALAEEADPEEHVIETEATIDIPRAQEPELEEIKNTEPVEVEENIPATDQSAEEIRATEAMETEANSERIDASSSELTEDVKRKFALDDDAAHEEHVIAAETTVHIPRAQEPELEEIKNTEPVEVKENISASDLTAEEVKETEATETELISESTDANISEPTEDAETNFALADEAAPEEHVIATEATYDIPRAQEPELEEIENAEHVEVEENILANDLPAEEVEDTETIETEAINDSTDANITELTEDVALADEAVSDVHVNIPPAVEESNNTEPVGAEDTMTADDVPAEEINDTEAMETEEIPHESTDDSLTTSAPLADIQQAPEQEAVEDKKCTDTTENQGEPQQTIVSTAAELTPAEEKTIVTEPTRDTHVQNAAAQEIEGTEHVKNQEFSDHNILSTAEVTAQESTLLGGELASDVQQLLERDSTEETRGTEAVQTEGVSNLEKPVSENNESESEPNVANEVQEGKSAEVEDTEATEMEEISIQDNIPTTENAAQESSELGSYQDLLVQSEDSKDQLVKAEETVQSNGATLEEPTAEDNAANETDLLADTKEEHGLESVEGNKGIDATEGEEASHPSQDAGLEELVSESIVATIEPTSDIQQVNDLDEAKEMTATEAINDEDTSCNKTEVASLEDLSPTDNGTSPKEKDKSSGLGEKTAFTTQKGESPAEEDGVRISGEDTVRISNNIEQIKEQSKAVTEDDAIKSGEHTSDQDDKQLHNVELQMQVYERSVDVSAMEQPDKDVKKVNLDQQQKEDEAIEEQTEEIQGNEQKHDDSSADLSTETLLEPQSNEIGTTDLNQDTDVFEAEQTETVATEMLMNEQTLHIPQGSIPSTADVKVENSTEIEETPEQENAPNNIGTLYTDADAENYNEDEKENIEIDAAVAKPSTDKQDGTTDETINEEVGNGLASPVEKDLQQTSDPAPSNEDILENNPTVVPQNVETRVDREEKECINKANDDMQAIQASEEEIVDLVGKNKEMQNEDTDVNNDEVQTKPVDEETSELHSNDSTENKMDDTMSPDAEMVHGRIDAQPKEIEEVGENKGFSYISEYVLEQSKQNDVDQDLSIHPKVVEAEQNDAEVETNSNEEMATRCTAVTEAVKFDEAIYDKASGADGALSDENLETLEDNRRNHEASTVVTALGESMKEDKEHHNLVLPADSAVDGNTTEQASGLEVTERGLLFPEKPLPTESEEHEESQTTKEQDEDDTHEQETGDTDKEEKEAEQSDLPVSNFLMNLIMGKESTKPDGNLEFETEKKQEETTKDDSCLITSQQEESLVPIPTENNVDNKFIFEQGRHNPEGSEETHDFKLESDEVLSRNAHNLEEPVWENNVQGEISSELVPGGPGLMTEVEIRDVKLGEKATNSEEGSLNNNLDDSTNPKVSQEDTLEEGRTDLQHESLSENISSDAVARQTLLSREPDTGDEKKLPEDNDDLQSPLSTKREGSTESSITEAESTIEAELDNEVEKEEEEQHTTNTGGATEGQIENLHDNSQKETEAISDEQTAEITEPVMGTEINLVHEKENSAGSECEEEIQSSKLSNSELHNSEKALDIQSDGSSLHTNQDKQDEFAGDQIVMEKNNLLDKPGESNLHEEQETEIGQESPKESDGGDQNCLAITEPVIKEENANRTVESHVKTVNTKSSEEQEIFMSQVQEHGLDVVSAKEAPEAEENIVEMAKPEFSADEEHSSKEDKSNMAEEKTCVEKTKDEEEAKSFTDQVTTKIEEQGAVQKGSHNPTRDLNVVLPTEAPGSEESFVDIKTPEFSTDEEQSPKEDESNMAEEKSYDEKTKGDKEAKNFTDEAPMKIEEREAGQKASPKKHNILSGVGSKVKHQLAKVKKAIIGKPSHTKSELAKS